MLTHREAGQAFMAVAATAVAATAVAVTAVAVTAVPGAPRDVAPQS